MEVASADGGTVSNVTINEIAAALDGKRTGDGWTCHCPVHSDGSPSLSIGESGGKILVHCFAGCSQADVISALKDRGLWPSGGNGRSAGGRREICRYDYQDAAGDLLYQVVRFDPKDFRQYDAVRKVWNLNDVERVPYRLPDLLRAIGEGKGIFLVEGEKDVEALRALGLTATTNQGGSGSASLWKGFAKKYFHADVRVYVVPDADDPGQLLAADAARHLQAAGCDVKKIDLGYPIGKKHGKDVSDWLAEGHTREELIALASAAPLWVAAAPPAAVQEEQAVDTVLSTPEEGVVRGLREIARQRREQIAATAPRDTGTGNAELFALLAEGRLKYVPAWGWVYFDEKRWARDDVGMRFELAKIVGEVRQKLLAQADPNTLRERVKFVQRSLSATGIRETVFLAESSPRLIARPGDFDRSAMLFNCANGTLNLSTLELLPHRAEDMLTRVSEVEYLPDATCPIFERFMSEITCGNEDLSRFKKRWAGYSLCGDTSEQKFVIWHGVGANGKGTEAFAYQLVLGEYATTTPASTFLEARNGGPTNDLAALAGVRAVFASETGQGEALAESKVKALVGEDVISCRFLFREFFTYRPGFKLVLATNHRPRIRGNDYAIWRRVRLVPFSRIFAPEERDLHLREKLRAEGSGILNWMVAGYQDWLEHGLAESEAVMAATDEYQQAEDRFAEFIGECRKAPDASCFSFDLYSTYTAWAERNHERSVSQKAFSMAMVERGFVKTPTKMGKVFSGIEPKSSEKGDGL